MDTHENKYLLQELVEVNENFQNSINLQLDLNKKAKVLSYIPTKSSVEILERYLRNIEGDTKEKATLLIGPYGKGKSHLLLVLISIITSGYEEEDNELVDILIDRIRKVSESTAEYILSIRKKGKKYLPVIITNTQMDLNQAFLLGINESLKRANLEDIIPDSYYTEAIKIIENWEKNYNTTYESFKLSLNNNKMTVQMIKEKLKQCDKEALSLFSVLYPDLTAGSIFNPMINTEIITLYENINNEICEKYNYAGIFIVFDEFSKYIEGHDVDTMANDMKVLQDICELSNNSKENQIHTLLIAHKSIKEYSNVLSKEIINAYVGVEGRIKEVLFVSSSKNNYELIQNAIIKKPAFNEMLSKQNTISRNEDEVYSIPAFRTLFEKEDFRRIVQQGCFPLSPVSAYLLLGISEKVAQNERTLFTFICKDEPFSMARRIKEDEKGYSIISADCIFDYFKTIFKSDFSNQFNHNEWLKADYAVKQCSDLLDQSIIKTIAILNINHKFEEVPPTLKYIAMAAGVEEEDAKVVLDRLIKLNIIDYRKSTEFYYFKNNVGVNLEKEIKKSINAYNGNLNMIEVLTSVAKIDYILPKAHNQKNNIKRYFESKYCMYEDFMNMKSSKVWFDEKYADGKVIYLISNKIVDVEKCRTKIKELNDNKIIVVIPNKEFNKSNKLEQYKALQRMKEQNDFLSEHKGINEEILLYEEELLIELNQYIKTMFDLSNKKTQVLYSDVLNEEISIKNEKDLNRFVSNICDKIYYKTPIINNEMINKNNISSQIKTARNSLITKIIEKQEVLQLYNGTSPEASIFRSTLVYSGVTDSNFEVKEGLKEILNRIREYILSCEENKRCFSELYNIITKQPYGMRQGTIPIYIAFSLRMLEDMPIIYLNGKEVPLDANTLSNINENPDSYYLHLEKGTTEKISYLNNLRELFIKYEKIQDSKCTDIDVVVLRMQRWMQSLAKVATNFEYDSIDSIKKSITIEEYKALVELRKILKKAECNSRDLLFDKIPQLFSGNSLNECFDHICNIKKISDQYVELLMDRIISDTKEIFDRKSSDDLATVLKIWYSEQSTSSKNIITSTKTNSFMAYIGKIDTYNSKEIVNRISKILLDIHVENWSLSSLEQYLEELSSLKCEIEMIRDKSIIENKNSIIIKSKDKIIERYYEEYNDDDSTGYFFKNAIQSAVDDFGDSLEVNQKVSILVQLIDKLIN